MSQTFRELPEQAKYIQVVKWQKTICEKGHGFNFPEKEHMEGKEESLEIDIGRRGVQEVESSSEESQ